MRLSKLAVVLSIGSSIHWGAAEARVFRCVDSDGHVTYSQSPCPADQQSDQMRGLSGARHEDGSLCGLARKLAATAFLDMADGVEPSAVIDQYGGLNHVNAPTLGVINFAASLRYNDELSPQRVGALTFSRCREGGFGKLQPGDLPPLEKE